MSLVGTRSNKLSAVLAYENLPQYGHCRMTATVTIAAGMDIGAVLKRSLSAGTAVAGAVVGTGNGTVGTLTFVDAPNAQIGSYSIKFTSATAFEVMDPQGDVSGVGTTGAAYSNNGLGFTVTAGGTAFVSGDSIPVTTAATVKYTWIANADVLAGLPDDVVVLIDHYKDPISLTPGDYSLAVLNRGSAAVVGAALLYANTVSAANQAIVQGKLLAKGIKSMTQV